MNLRRGMLTLVMLGLLAWGAVVGAQDSSIQGGDDAQLRAFIARYLGVTGSPTPIGITVGALPQLPFALPLPDGVTVIGSVTRYNNPGDTSANTSYDIALEGGGDTAQLFEFIRQGLTNAGWSTIQADVAEQGGFNTSVNAYGVFCLPDNSASLTLNPYTPDGTLILSNIVVTTPADIYQCQTITAQAVPGAYEQIPPLALPEGVTLVNNTGGGLSYYSDGQTASNSAILNSTLPLGDIAAGYVTQLTTLGWTMVDSDNGERFFISDWTLTDGNGKAWRGTFILTRDIQPDIVNALIYVKE